MPWSDATLVTRAFPGAYFLFIAVFYTWRILLLGRRAGASPVHKGEQGSAERRHHVRFVVMRALILASTSCGKRAQSAVMPSLDCTARITQVSS